MVNLTQRRYKDQQAVAIASKEIQFSGHDIKYNFPAHSFTQMLIPSNRPTAQG